MPDTKTSRAATFWDKIADKYAAKPVPSERVYEEKLRVTREYLTPESKVVEFGCGTGSTAIAHAPHVKHILATDISARMVEIAQSKARNVHVGNVTFAQSSVEEMDVGEASVDVVMGHSILHLVDDRHAVIDQVHEMLKPGGVFISSTACIARWTMAWFWLVGPIGYALGFFPKVGIFSAPTLVADMKRAGFSIDHEWQPKGAMSVFLVARKAG